jgi:ArsR family transcriptional regulator
MTAGNIERRAAGRRRALLRGAAAAYIRLAPYDTLPMTSLPGPTQLLTTVAEPTRLRILNCLAAAPLFVSDLQAVLGLPQPTVSRHLQVLRRAEVVRDTPIAQFVLYRLRRDASPQGRLLGAILDAVVHEPSMRAERERAGTRSRRRTAARLPDARRHGVVVGLDRRMG